MQSKKLSVVQIIDRLNVGGAEQVLVSLGNILYAHGHDTAVITTVTPGPLAEKLNPNIPLINLNRGWKWNPVIMYRLAKAAKKFDVVHVHSSYNLRYLFLASRLFFLQKKIFFHEHFGDRAAKAPNWCQQLTFPKTILITPSTRIGIWATHKLKMNREKVFVLPNIVIRKGVDNLQYKNDEKYNLIIVSNFLVAKNIEFAVEVFSKLLAERKAKYHLTIIGHITDIQYYAKILDNIRQKNLEHMVTVINDCIDVQPLLHQFHLGLHASISESGPLVLIEYMAQSLPFLSYETGEVVAQIKNELPECIIGSFDPDEWIKKIEYLLNTDKQLLRQKLSKAFATYYSEESYYEKCIAIYEAGLGLK